jgi:hypothetical protein
MLGVGGIDGMRHFLRVLRWKLFARATKRSDDLLHLEHLDADHENDQRAVLPSRPAIRLGLPGDFILEFRLFVRE